MKKIIAMFVTVAFASAFVGCGGGSPPVDEGPSGDGGEVGAEPGAEEDLGGGGDAGGSEEEE